MVVSAALPPVEGMGYYVWNLSRQLTRQGHKIHIITRGGAHPTSRQQAKGITIWRPPFLPIYPFHVHLHALYVDLLFRRLEPELDLIHLHTPLVKHPRTRLPSLVTVHTPMRADVAAVSTDSLTGILARLQGPVSYRLEQQLFDRAGKIVAVANSVAAELAAYGVDRSRVAVLGNGVDTALFSPNGTNANTSLPYILTAGRLAPRKGLEDLIQCAQLVRQQIPSVRFLIAGSGPLEGALRDEIARRNMKANVILLGHIADHRQMVELYRGAAAYLHPAHYEGLPTVLLEAMACGRPVVATAVSGALDVIQDERNGLLTPPRCPQQLASAVLRLLADPRLGERLGAVALDTIQQRYSWEVVGRSYLDQYRDLLSRTGNVASA